ncbi:MAG TPA: universal stress protein [Dehalococcoidia bacterium]|nr:universal stress protein [Dehalococcoidia bacterium]
MAAVRPRGRRERAARRRAGLQGAGPALGSTRITDAEDAMFQRMLVPLDGTRSSAAVVPYAVELAARLGCRVDLVLVQPREGARLPHPEHHSARARSSSPAPPVDTAAANREYLRRHAAEFEARGLPTDVHLRIGEPVEEILRAALELRSDVIAMATLSRERYPHRNGASVAQEVLWRSRLPVLLLAEG